MQKLGLDPAKALEYLSWHARLTQKEAIDWTARWYEHWRNGGDARTLVISQIDAFTKGHFNVA